MTRLDIPPVEPGGDLFDGQTPWHDAILSIHDPSWTVYAEGYRLAAEHLAGTALSDSSQRDFLIYPMLFLYRQFLELSLKEALRYVEELDAGETTKLPVHHKLAGLWGRFQTAMERVNDGSLDQELKVIENALIQFGELDPTSQLFRYPEDREGEPVSYPFERVSLPTLRNEMRNAAVAFRMMNAGLGALVDQHREMLGEMGP